MHIGQVIYALRQERQLTQEKLALEVETATSNPVSYTHLDVYKRQITGYPTTKRPRTPAPGWCWVLRQCPRRRSSRRCRRYAGLGSCKAGQPAVRAAHPTAATKKGMAEAIPEG